MNSKEDRDPSFLDNCVMAINTCKLHVKLIVVVGNILGNNLEGNPKWWFENDNEKESTRTMCLAVGKSDTQLLHHPLLQKNIVEIHFDFVFTDKTTPLPPELFQCVNVRILSLRRNNLVCLPVEIGRLTELRTLILTENHLTINSIPYTLTFCKNLTTLYLDHNLLDALPGFLLDMPQLETVYRHGNHNYFKSTFMWYHSAKQDRVMPYTPNRVPAKLEGTLHQPQSLESHSIKSLIASRINFFAPGLLPVTVQDYVAKVYKKYKICAFCCEAFNEYTNGFRVFTFKSPYLGNTCVPFEHWTCSRECGVGVEEPAYKQERDQAQHSDRQYQQYIQSVQKQFNNLKHPHDRTLRNCVLL